jgi:predicted dehydrogenase
MLLGGCHALDAIRYLSGSEVAEVAAFGNNIKGGYEYEANVVASLKFENGMIGKTSTLFDAEIPYSFNIDLVGTEGALRDNRVWSKPLFPGQTSWTEMKTIMPDSGAVDHHPFDAQMQHLVDCILEDRQSHCSVADAFHTHELCLAIDRSMAEGGKPVRVERD